MIRKKFDGHMGSNDVFEPEYKRVVLAPIRVPHEFEMLINPSSLEMMFEPFTT
jgi:hypothetical protein